MNLFKTGRLTWQQVAVLKLALLLVGIAIGANWPSTFAPYTLLLLVVAVLLGLYIKWVWVRQ
jgi:hypothetical protein